MHVKSAYFIEMREMVERLARGQSLMLFSVIAPPL
jgi:hypothetical protein